MSINNLFSLKDKIAVVTGGSRGLGLYMCEAFILSGCSKVYVSSRNQEACEQACNELNSLAKSKGLGGVAIPFAADASNTAGIEKLLKFVSSQTKKVHILAANAGAAAAHKFGTHTEKALDDVLGINFKGVFLTIQSFAPLLEAAGTFNDPSRVVITGSVAGVISNMSGGTYGYLASKAAIHHVGKTLAVELGPKHITVNILAPGYFPTKMTDNRLNIMGNELVKANPLGRLGEREDIYGAAIYLCSPAGKYCNATILTLDGGEHAGSMIA